MPEATESLNNSTPQKSQRLIRYKAVAEKTDQSQTTIRRLVESGTFPQPVKLSKFSRAFVESEVDAWIAERIAERDAETA